MYWAKEGVVNEPVIVTVYCKGEVHMWCHQYRCVWRTGQSDQSAAQETAVKPAEGTQYFGSPYKLRRVAVYYGIVPMLPIRLRYMEVSVTVVRTAAHHFWINSNCYPQIRLRCKGDLYDGMSLNSLNLQTEAQWINEERKGSKGSKHNITWNITKMFLKKGCLEHVRIYMPSKLPLCLHVKGEWKNVPWENNTSAIKVNDVMRWVFD